MTIEREENPLYQFMNLINRIRPGDDLRLTPREIDILYKFYSYNSKEIDLKSKNMLMDDFSFSSKTQVGAYIAVLFKKQAISRSPVKSGAYLFNPVFFPPEGKDVSEIIIKIT